MIARISGKLLEKNIETVVIEAGAGGLGYEVTVPLSTYSKLPEVGEDATLITLLFIKEDAIKLYGFYTTGERDIFTLLTSVSGVGPKLARNILSGAGADELSLAIIERNVAALVALPGVGKKTAERLILELKDKVIAPGLKERIKEGGGEGPEGLDVALEDVVSALENLGFKPVAAQDAAKAAREENPDAGFDALLRKALKQL